MIYDERTKRYYHSSPCHIKLIKEREMTCRENEQWDALFQYIMNLHDLVVFPKGNITRLKDLRAGYIMKDGKRVRQWRTGPDYALMLDAYKLAENSIKWCIANKLNGSKDTKAINYGISIMIDKLNEANDRRKLKMRQQQIIKSNKEDDQLNKNIEINYISKRPRDNDISDFL
ncbi:hypothetical protein [Paenibacillus lautus]|uniref:hypothetical protein n=1 Tax=Paenibacillus lautus TaxID=1401 RepID=UPI001C7D0E68|nr:hypothetical protein [Paenibacillus lautus]